MELKELQLKDLISILISGAAFCVALYGILERGLAARRALRVRLTELIDDLVQIDVSQRLLDHDQGKPEDVKAAVRDGNALRRALLAAQAVDILFKYKRRITIPEYVSLAEALRETSDTTGQRRVLEAAVAELKAESPFQQAAAWRAWAWFNFQQGHVEIARKAVRRSLDIRHPVDDITRHEKLVTLLSWFDYEFQTNPAERSSWTAVINEAETVVPEIRNDDWRVNASERVKAARERSAPQRVSPTSDAGVVAAN